MAAAGYNNREIAKMTGRHTNTVENTLRQPWAREYLITEAKKTVQDEIKAILESEALPSIRKLVAVRDGEGVRPSDVITASNSLLDRFLGKPVQPMTTDAKPVAQLSDEELRAQVQAELTKTSPN
jgi:IS30 family transposase